MAIPLLLFVSALSFLLVSITPGSVAQRILGPFASQDAIERLQRAMGLDKPLYDQYWQWLTRAFHGNLGVSTVTQGESVTQTINQRLPVSISLIAGALIVTLLLGVGFGVFSAVRGGLAGRLVDGLSLVGFALPSYWIGAVLVTLFAVNLHWLPATGYVPLTESPRRWALSLVLPVVALALVAVANVARQTREAMLDALSSEYVRMAWASGVSASSIFFRHALKNAAIRVLTVIGITVVGLLGGTVLVEAVFALPGLGGLAVDATSAHDLPMIQGVVVYFTLIVVGVNLVVDLAYSLLDPRVRTH
jgi:peptide/nickel transport system permease protein